MAMVSISLCSVSVIVLSIASVMYNAASAPQGNPLTGAAQSPPWWQNYGDTTRYLQDCGLPSVAFLSSFVPGTTKEPIFASCYDQQHIGQIRPICFMFAARVQSLCPAYKSKLSDKPEFRTAMESAFMNYEQEKNDPLSFCTDIKPEGLSGIGNAFENFDCVSECGYSGITPICRSYAFLSTVAGQMLMSSAGGEQNQQDGVDDKDAGLAEEQAAAGQATDERAGVSVKSPAETMQEGTDNQAKGNNPYGDQLAVSELKDSQGQNPGDVSPGDQGGFAAPAADGTKQEMQQPSGVGENTDQGATIGLQGDGAAAAVASGGGVGTVSERQGVNQGTYQGSRTPAGQGGTPTRAVGADDTRQPTNPDSNPAVSQNQGTLDAQGGSPPGGHTVSGGMGAGDAGRPTYPDSNPAASPNQLPLDRQEGSQTGGHTVSGPAGAGDTDQQLQNDGYEPHGPSDVQGGSRMGGLTAPERVDAGNVAEITPNRLNGVNAPGVLPGTNQVYKPAYTQDGQYNRETAWQNQPPISQNTDGTGDGLTINEATGPRLDGGAVGGQGQNGPYDAGAADKGVSNQQTINGQNIVHTGDTVPHNGAAGGETGVGQPDGQPGTNQQVDLGPDAGGRQEETQNGDYGNQLLPEGDLSDSQGGNRPGIQQNVESGVGGDQQEGHQEEEGEFRSDDQAVGENGDNADNQHEEKLLPEDDYSEESDYPGNLPPGDDDGQFSQGDASNYDGDNAGNDRDYQDEDESYREDDRQRENENVNQESQQQVHEQVHKDIVYEEDEESSHFLAYSLTAIILILATYIMYHNKQKIIAVVVEGRNGKGRRRRQGYQKLDQNISEAMPSLQKA